MSPECQLLASSTHLQVVLHFFHSYMSWCQKPSPQLTVFAILSEFLPLPGPQFLHLSYGASRSPCLLHMQGTKNWQAWEEQDGGKNSCYGSLMSTCAKHCTPGHTPDLADPVRAPHSGSVITRLPTPRSTWF